MAKKLNIADIIKEAMKNTSYTQEELEEIRSLMESLRGFGVGRREYQLTSPLDRRRIRTENTEELDPRTIKLTASRR